MQKKEQLAKKIITVADAVAMNAAPEYWSGIKSAGLHVISLFSMAKIFLLQNGIHQ
jgi:hypothetical protein